MGGRTTALLPGWALIKPWACGSAIARSATRPRPHPSPPLGFLISIECGPGRAVLGKVVPLVTRDVGLMALIRAPQVALTGAPMLFRGVCPIRFDLRAVVHHGCSILVTPQRRSAVMERRSHAD